MYYVKVKSDLLLYNLYIYVYITCTLYRDTFVHHMCVLFRKNNGQRTVRWKALSLF